MSDIQNLEARVAVLEALAAKAVGGGVGGAAQAAGGGYQSPGQWLAGSIASGLPPGGPTGQGGPGAQAAGEVTGTSTCWCESRFVCATMKCGGSGWC